jgi:hypothetical protein
MPTRDIPGSVELAATLNLILERLHKLVLLDEELCLLQFLDSFLL